MSPGHTTLELRLRYDRGQLESLERHISDLEAAERNAKAAYEAASAHLDTVQAQLHDLRDRKKELSYSTDDLRYRLLPRLVARVPAEIWREIFLQLARPALNWSTCECEYHREGLRAPFRLAAVNTLWRAVATRTSALWTYVLVYPPGPKGLKNRLNLISLLMKRSARAPLQIMLPWDKIAQWTKDHTTICTTLAASAPRWQRIFIFFPVIEIPRPELTFLRNPTPLLEAASFRRMDAKCSPDWEDRLDPFLPICPKLRHFVSQDDNVLFAVPPAPLLGLVHLELRVLVSCSIVWGILRSAPRLESLDIGFYRIATGDDRLRDSQGHHISLPVLRSLISDSPACAMLSANAPLLSMPALTDYKITTKLVSNLQPLIPTIHATLADLLINTEDALGGRAADILRPLAALRRVRFTRCKVTNEFISALASPHAVSGEWMWPLLESITFSWRSDPGSGLIDVLSARKLASTQSDGPVPIKTIVFAGASAAPWYVAQVRYFLGETVEENLSSDSEGPM